MDEPSANRIERVLGKKYVGSVRLYKFPIEKCKEIKAYKVLEENKSEETKRLLEESTEGGNKKAMKIKNKKNIKTLKRCSRRAYRAGECYNFQALGCDVLNKKTRTALFFKSVREREAYAKSKPGKRALSRCDRISRYSVVSATKGKKTIRSHAS
jgi:hypothetical protein